MKLIRKLGVNTGLVADRGGARILISDLDACYSTGSGEKLVRVRDVSPTGVYILTDDQWAPGTRFTLTVQKWTLQEKAQPALRFEVKVVRHGNDGAGLAFVHDGIDAAIWSHLVRYALRRMAVTDSLQMLCLSRALAFSCRICASHPAQGLRLILDESTYETGIRSVEILVAAEDLVIRRQSRIRANVTPTVLREILRSGARENQEIVRRCWAGVLAATALEAASDQESLAYAGLFSKIDSTQLRILAASCRRAAFTTDDTGQISVQRSACSPEEIRRITGLRDLGRIGNDLDRLHDLGLIEKTVKADPFGVLPEANLTPTRTGLTLYAMCNGRLQPVRPSNSPALGTPVPAESESEDDPVPAILRLTWASAR